MGIGAGIEPGHIVGQDRNNIVHVVHTRKLPVPAAAIPVHLPLQSPHRCGPFPRPHSRRLRLRHARSLARTPAPPHRQHRLPPTP